MNDQKKILIADTDALIQRVLSMRLEISGYHVICVPDGDAAMEKVQQERPDLIILDIVLPVINGYEVCRMLKFDSNFENLPAIALSALDRQRDREKAVAAGFDAYFIKPADLRLLLVKIEDLISDFDRP